MGAQVVDLAGPAFWLIFGLALLLLTPVERPRVRAWLWAAVNLLFLKQFLFKFEFVFLFSAIVATFLLLQFAPRRRGAVFAVVVLGSATLGLFVIHKFPAVSATLKAPTLATILTAIGFSYVALRIVEVLRAVSEGRHAPPDFPSTINYLLPFHMLAAGPIQSYDDFARQPSIPRILTLVQALRATERIAWGLFKKFVLAYALQRVFLTGFTIPGWQLLLEVQLFYIWLYLDFSGLTDVAVGIGTLLGIATPENFDRPYLARNMIDFWERWHISLSQFIRRNLYIPIQLFLMRKTGARHPLWCSTIAFTVAFGLCGLWHAGTVRFLLWGLWHAAGLIVTNLYRHFLTRRLGNKGVKEYMENKGIRFAATVLTFEFVAFSLLIIQAPGEVFWP